VSDATDDLDTGGDIELAELDIETTDTADQTRDRAGELGADADADGPRPRKRIDKGLLAACFVIAAGLALIGWGLSSALTGTEGVDRPEVIEEISPVENAIQVLQQGNVMVDFEFGYEAVLVIDGIELETSRLGEVRDDIEPGEQQTTDPSTAVFDPGNARISFQPTEGAPIEEFSEGRHNAQVIYWRIEEGREDGARSYRWSFDVI
jgi:hypothetical protein